MTWLGTDLVALGCILGSAAAGGAATFAIMDGADRHAHRCEVEARTVSPRIAISHGGTAHAIVVRPDVRVRSIQGCVADANEVVEVHMDTHLEQLDAQMEQLDRVLEVQLEQMESQIEASVQQEMEAQLQLKEAARRMEEARARVRVKIEKAGSGQI
jgi:hypothetical protein